MRAWTVLTEQCDPTVADAATLRKMVEGVVTVAVAVAGVADGANDFSHAAEG